MSTAQKTLIDAIRRIALDSEALASALGDLQKRGVIDGIKTTLGGYNELQDDCCTDGDGNPDDPSDEKDPIDEDAPPEVPDIGDDDGDGESDWSDCETGEPITFTPGGFPRPETCKDCSRPDPQWQFGYVWIRISPPSDPCNYYASSPAGAMSKGFPSNVDGVNVTDIRVGDVIQTDQYGKPTRYSIDGFYATLGLWQSLGYVARNACDGSPPCKAEFCTEEAPIIEDCQDWDSDNTTSYTLANGCIVASTCDPDASAAAHACNECITICNEDGEERRVCAIGNGQWILYDPNGKYKGGRYDATGRRLEILPAGETGGYLPSERNPTGGGGYDGGTFGGGDGWVWN